MLTKERNSGGAEHKHRRARYDNTLRRVAREPIPGVGSAFSCWCSFLLYLCFAEYLWESEKGRSRDYSEPTLPCLPRWPISGLVWANNEPSLLSSCNVPCVAGFGKPEV